MSQKANFSIIFFDSWQLFIYLFSYFYCVYKKPISYCPLDVIANGATTVIYCGDSASAINKAGVADNTSHVSTGRNASREFMEGKVLPGVAALKDR